MFAYQGNLCDPEDENPAAFSGAEFYNFDIAAVGLGFHVSAIRISQSLPALPQCPSTSQAAGASQETATPSGKIPEQHHYQVCQDSTTPHHPSQLPGCQGCDRRTTSFQNHKNSAVPWQTTKKDPQVPQLSIAHIPITNTTLSISTIHTWPPGASWPGLGRAGC